jgi:hypothetical protein
MYNNADRTPVVVADVIINEGFVGLVSLGENHVSVYPNPTSNQLIVSADLPLGLIKIMSISGAVQFEKRINGNRAELNIKRLQPGFYLVEFGSTERIVKKFFVN